MHKARAVLFLFLLGVTACGTNTHQPIAPTDVNEPISKLKPWDLSKIVSIDVVRNIEADTTVYLRTEFARGEMIDLEMKFVQVVDDFMAPIPLYLLEASDSTLISLGGIARGMSGSPIFTESGTWGAIAYGFNNQGSPPLYFFATPIEWVVGTKGTVPLAKRTADWQGKSVVPLETPLLITGPNHSGESSFLNSAITAGLTRERQTSFEPGRPLAIALLLGEYTIASFGTISFVDGDKVYGFGHAMQRAGPVKLPIIEAKVLGEVSDRIVPYKYVTLNPNVRGTLLEDRIPAVRGVLGDEPELVTINSVYIFPNEKTVELAHAMPAELPSPGMGIRLAATAFFDPLLNRIERDPNHSIRVTSNIAFDGTDLTLARTRLFASPEGFLYGLVQDAFFDLTRVLDELVLRNDYALDVQEADVLVELFPESRFAHIVNVTADTMISPGTLLDVVVGLRVGRRVNREITLSLEIPDTIVAGSYSLEVGSLATLEDESEPLLRSIDNQPQEEDRESLEDIFARVNGEDKNVVLKAQMRISDPLLEDIGADPRVPGGGIVPPPFDIAKPEVMVTVQKTLGLILQGSARTEVIVHDAEETGE